MVTLKTGPKATRKNWLKFINGLKSVDGYKHFFFLMLKQIENSQYFVLDSWLCQLGWSILWTTYSLTWCLYFVNETLHVSPCRFDGKAMPVDGLLIVAEDTELASEAQPTLKISFTQKSTETEASLHDYKLPIVQTGASKAGWWFQIFLFSPRKLGEMIPIRLVHIFQMGGSTTNWTIQIWDRFSSRTFFWVGKNFWVHSVKLTVYHLNNGARETCIFWRELLVSGKCWDGCLSQDSSHQ